jgi:integrase
MQALSALLFLYRDVLRTPLGDLRGLLRSRVPIRLPVVLTPEEVGEVLAHLRGTAWVVAALLYGSGLRLMEALTLRVRDLDFSRREILVRRAKGGNDRVTMLPESLKAALERQLERVRALHKRDLAAGGGMV